MQFAIHCILVYYPLYTRIVYKKNSSSPRRTLQVAPPPLNTPWHSSVRVVVVSRLFHLYVSDGCFHGHYVMTRKVCYLVTVLSSYPSHFMHCAETAVDIIKLREKFTALLLCSSISKRYNT